MRRFAELASPNIDPNQLSLSFEALYPTPEGEDWYMWRITNWGTKWDLDPKEVAAYQEPDKLQYSFDTAWSPPSEWVQKVMKDFPELNFELLYEESGVGFAGLLKASGGIVTQDVIYDHGDPEYVPFCIEYFGDEYFGDDYEEEDEE